MAVESGQYQRRTEGEPDQVGWVQAKRPHELCEAIRIVVHVEVLWGISRSAGTRRVPRRPR